MIFCQTDHWYFQRTQFQKQDLERSSLPSWTVSVYQHLLKGWRLRNQKQITCWQWIRMRENGDNLNFNFISLSTPTVDKNWVYWHIICCIVGKWCGIWLKLFVNSKFTERSFLCAQLDLFTSFVCLLLDCEYSYSQVIPSFWLCLCADILGYAVCIFRTTDTKYVMFCIG